ncbi:glycosyltransferase [Microbacterium arabinogalactanolyticum]|uniref:glycosyltransferase n=1 Tax=Microbacterium arabinogalactanolyticum TaxID=69365 RepID=UPI004043D804
MEMLKVFDWSPRLLRRVREIDPDIIHAHFGNDASRVRRVAKVLRKPLVVTLHGADVTASPRRPGIRGYRNRRRLQRVFRDAALLIGVSDFIRDEAIRLGADPSKTVVHHIGIPVHERLSSGGESWDIAFVGRLVAKKGVPDLLQAASEASRLLGRVLRLVVVGDGPLLQELETLAAVDGITVDFMGRRSPDEVREILARSSIFAGPSRRASNGDSEGFGMVFLEAAAAGLPVLAYRHGGVVEAVEDGVTGLLADEGDVQGLAANIARVLGDESLRRRMAEAGRARVEAEFDVLSQTVELERGYDLVLGEFSAHTETGR